MKEEGFEFKCGSTLCFQIEEAIRVQYDLGTRIDSSNFYEIKPDGSIHEEINIYGDKKRISCNISACKIEDSDLYLVKVSDANVTKIRRKR